jgi:hypothetical protein
MNFYGRSLGKTDAAAAVAIGASAERNGLDRLAGAGPGHLNKAKGGDLEHFGLGRVLGKGLVQRRDQ